MAAIRAYFSEISDFAYRSAWYHVKCERYKKANELCELILDQPETSTLHQAGAHLILAHSPENDVGHHVRVAVELVQRFNPAETEADEKAQLAAQAERMLEEAKNHAEDLPKHPLTKEQQYEAMATSSDTVDGLRDTVAQCVEEESEGLVVEDEEYWDEGEEEEHIDMDVADDDDDEDYGLEVPFFEVDKVYSSATGRFERTVELISVAKMPWDGGSSRPDRRQ